MRQVRRLERLCRLLGTEWERIQTVADEKAATLMEAEPERREAYVTGVVELLRATLLSRGASSFDAKAVCERMRRNWLEALERGEYVDIHSVFHTAIRDSMTTVRRLIKQQQERPVSTRKWRKVVVGLGEIVTAGGAVVFDVQKAVVVASVPDFVCASVIAGGFFFRDGVKTLLGLK